MLRGGKGCVSSPPAFSNDAKRLLICTGNTVSIFSTSTGLQVAALEGHTALVTSVIVVPASNAANKVLCNCWTSSLDGTIRYWDFSLSELMKTIDIRFPVFSMVIPSFLSPQEESNAKSPKLFAYVSVEDKNGKGNQHNALHGQIRKCNLTKGRLSGGVILKETPRPEFLTVSPLGKFIGIRDKRKIHIWEVPRDDSDSFVARKITLHHTKTLKVLAFHPTERIVAAGDVTGRILIWRGFGAQDFMPGSGTRKGRPMKDEEERPGVRGNDDAELCTTWHWHSAEVKVLFFSLDGAYLYSGGREGVLVVWQLDTGKKKYLPRIGSPLIYYTASPDPSLSSISCADNQVHLLKMPSMEIEKSISGIKPPLSSPEICEGISNKVAFDCSSGLVAVQTDNYCVQLYSLFDDRGVYEVQVCERNHQPVDELTVVVTLVALSLDGSLMGTAEVKLPEDGIGGLICLKFWEMDPDSKRFKLSTLVYEPHRDAHISAIAFHPTRTMAASCSYGGDFKIWVCKNGIQKDVLMVQNSCWMCHAVGSYKKKPLTAATFSSDGSILAVAAETAITLWDPDRNVLVAVIGETPTRIVTLSFVGNSEFLLSVSQGENPQLNVWAMSKLNVQWSYKLHVEAVACSASSNSFAVLALIPEPNQSTINGDGMILLFTVTDPIPVASWSVTKAQGGGLAFLQGSLSSLGLGPSDEKSPRMLMVYINGDHEYVVFCPYDTDAREINVSRRNGIVAEEETGLIGYASIYGKLPELDLKSFDDNSWVSTAPSERPWETIFSGSSHNLPPLTKLCSEFLESLLERRAPPVE